MASDTGNAVVAEWVGPAGHQLFDGTVLNPGVVVSGIGKDEAEGSDYWKVLGDADSYQGEVAGDASAIRNDWSFGTEEGGEATGRPLTEDQVAAPKASRRGKGAVASAPDPASASDPAADGGTE